jgi:hypothetical protein
VFWAFRERDWNAIQFFFQQGYDPTIRFKWSHTTPELEYSQVDGFTSASPADLEPTITFFGQLLDQTRALHGTTDALFDIKSINLQIAETNPNNIGAQPDSLLAMTGFPSTVRNVYLTTCGSTAQHGDYLKLLQTYFIHTNFSHFALDAEVLEKFSAHNKQCSDLLTWVLQQSLNGYWGGGCNDPTSASLKIEVESTNTAKIEEYVQSTWNTQNRWTVTDQVFDTYEGSVYFYGPPPVPGGDEIQILQFNTDGSVYRGGAPAPPKAETSSLAALESVLNGLRTGKQLPTDSAGEISVFVGPIYRCATGAPPTIGPSNLPPPIRQPTP